MAKGFTALQERKLRVDMVRNTIVQSKETFNFLNYDNFITHIAYSLGCEKRKAKEYINLAMEMENAKVNSEGEIVFNGK